MIQGEETIYHEQITSESFSNYALRFPYFGGVIRYSFMYQSDREVRKLRIERVGETARIWINGTLCGTSVQAPYEVHVDHAWHAGNNEIVIEVAVNQAYSHRDRYAFQLALPPMGLQGTLEAQFIFP